MEVGSKFCFEQRAATVLFNIISAQNCGDGTFLLPANICPIVPLVLCKAGRTFEFVDIDPNTLCLDHGAVLVRCAEESAPLAGIIYVRSYGSIIDTTNLFSKIKSLSPNAIIIDDRCLCPPEFNDVIPGDTDAILYSTGYGKYVDIGFGGYGVMRNNLPYNRFQLPFNPSDLDKLIKQYKNCLSTGRQFIYFDSNWLDLSHPLIKWEEYRIRIQQEIMRVSITKELINAVYLNNLPAEMCFPGHFQKWRFNIHVENKMEILDLIRREGLFASGHYEPLYKLFNMKNTPVAEKIHNSIINLFNDRYFDDERAFKLAELLTTHYC